MLLLLHSRIHIYYKNHVCIGRPSVLALVLCIASSASSQGIKFDHRHRMPLKPLVQSALLSVLGAAKAEVRPRIKQDGRPTHFRSSLFHAAVKLAGAVVLDGMATTFVLDCSAVRGLHDSALCPRVRVRSSEHFSFFTETATTPQGSQGWQPMSRYTMQGRACILQCIDRLRRQIARICCHSNMLEVIRQSHSKRPQRNVRVNPHCESSRASGHLSVIEAEIGD